MQRRKSLYTVLSALCVVAGLLGGLVVNSWLQLGAASMRNAGYVADSPSALPALAVFVLGLCGALVCELLAWRCDVRLRDEQHQAQLIAALKAIFNASRR